MSQNSQQLPALLSNQLRAEAKRSDGEKRVLAGIFPSLAATVALLIALVKWHYQLSPFAVLS